MNLVKLNKYEKVNLTHSISNLKQCIKNKNTYMGCGLSQKCAVGLPHQLHPPPKKLKKKKHDCHNSCKKRGYSL